MKTMTCNQLGGACDTEFHAETFDEMAQKAQQHGAEMMNDQPHLEAMDNMRALMGNPDAMQELHFISSTFVTLNQKLAAESTTAVV